MGGFRGLAWGMQELLRCPNGEKRGFTATNGLIPLTPNIMIVGIQFICTVGLYPVSLPPLGSHYPVAIWLGAVLG